MSELRTDEDGNKSWYNENGERHRENDPAVEFVNGNKYWYQNGELHREDGPAIEWNNGDKEWWFNGKQYTEEEYKEKMQGMKV